MIGSVLFPLTDRISSVKLVENDIFSVQVVRQSTLAAFAFVFISVLMMAKDYY